MLELRHIGKAYGEHTVLDDIDLTIGDGQIVSILGPSGGGKTTLLNVLLGITDTTSGQIVWNGRDFTHVPMEKRGFNIVFQDYALFPNLDAYENIVYGLHNNPGISTDEEVAELIELLGLEEHLHKRISQLSGGQKQRVALARTLVVKPRLLLLDEPLSALDGVIKESIKQKIKQIVEQYDLTTVMVTHDPEEALTMSDRVLILKDGRIAQYAAPDDIVNNPASPFIEDFILRQLQIKRDNIFALFGGNGVQAGVTEKNAAAVARDAAGKASAAEKNTAALARDAANKTHTTEKNAAAGADGAQETGAEKDAAAVSAAAPAGAERA